MHSETVYQFVTSHWISVILFTVVTTAHYTEHTLLYIYRLATVFTAKACFENRKTNVGMSTE